MYQIIGPTLSSQFNQVFQQLELPAAISQTVSGQFKEIESLLQSNNIPQLTPEQLLSNLSYSHFVELLKIEDHLKRSFYEIESIHNNWGSRELRRQISTLYYERLVYQKIKKI